MNRKHESCTVPGCTRPHKAQGFCRAHYQRHVRGQPMDAPMRGSGPKTCSVAGCTDEVHAAGLCLAHYARQRRGAPTEVEIKRRNMDQPEICTEPGCDKPTKSKGLCDMHYARLLRHGFTKYPDRKKPPKPCTIAGCENHVYASGLCNRHYLRIRRLKERFGLTLDQVAEMLSKQGGVCAICAGKSEAVNGASGKTVDFHVDHDHGSGAVRGLLCAHCNRGLGLFQDDPLILRAAATYLEHHAASAALENGAHDEEAP